MLICTKVRVSISDLIVNLRISEQRTYLRCEHLTNQNFHDGYSQFISRMMDFIAGETRCVFEA